MGNRRPLVLACVWAWLTCGVACADPVWVTDPNRPGPDAPPLGRSLFDHLTSRDGRQVVPFPFEALLASLQSRLAVEGAYLDRPLKKVLIPLGRSLQRDAAAPAFFESPRVVVAVDSEPRGGPGGSGMLLRDRLFVAYLEAADVLEIISYNEDAARFEFQVVTDYRHGGSPRVRYARRTVCTACHQNAAPIFARPLWDETNANAGIAGQLALIGAEFYGLPAKTGVDVAYAIDNATDRANDFALTQRLWESGCGNGKRGAHCRAAILTRAIQFALTGRRGFEHGSHDYRHALSSVLARTFAREWPDGLLLPDADIPNRKPLADVPRQVAARQPLSAPQLTRRADVTARFEPLEARAAKTVWTPDPDAAARRAITGISDFLAATDIRRIDAHLARADVESSTLATNCRIGQRRQASKRRMKLDCQGPDLAFRGIVYVADADRSLSGRLRDVRIHGEALGDLVVGGRSDDDNALLIRLTRNDSPGGIRLSNGDAVDVLTIGPSGRHPGPARAEQRIRHDFPSLQQAITRLAHDDTGPFTAGPFVRSRVLAPVFDAIGPVDGTAWCCSGDAGLPPPIVEHSDAGNGDSLLAPFLQVCAACHRSSERFPPNFLAGTPAQVRRGVAQCAQRIQYRLAMWDVDHGHRPKSPMPPRKSVGLGDAELETWTRGPLQRLKTALYEIAASERLPLQGHDRVVDTPYAELRSCLPTS